MIRKSDNPTPETHHMNRGIVQHCQNLKESSTRIYFEVVGSK